MVWDDQTGTWTVSSSTYLIRSTVLGGQLVTEVNNTGKKLQTYVIAAGAVIARQKVNTPDTSPTESVSWEHRDPGDTEVKYTNSSGGSSLDFVSDHYDTIGRMVGSPTFTSPTTSPHSIPSPFEEIPDELDPNKQCEVQVDGLLQKCDTVSADNTHVELRHGNKVYSAPLQEILPGVISFNVTFQDSATDVKIIGGEDYIDASHDASSEHSITMSFTLSWNIGTGTNGTRTEHTKPNVIKSPGTETDLVTSCSAPTFNDNFGFSDFELSHSGRSAAEVQTAILTIFGEMSARYDSDNSYNEAFAIASVLLNRSELVRNRQGNYKQFNAKGPSLVEIASAGSTPGRATGQFHGYFQGFSDYFSWSDSPEQFEFGTGQRNCSRLFAAINAFRTAVFSDSSKRTQALFFVAAFQHGQLRSDQFQIHDTVFSMNPISVR